MLEGSRCRTPQGAFAAWLCHPSHARPAHWAAGLPKITPGRSSLVLPGTRCLQAVQTEQVGGFPRHWEQPFQKAAQGRGGSKPG